MVFKQVEHLVKMTNDFELNWIINQDGQWSLVKLTNGL